MQKKIVFLLAVLMVQYTAPAQMNKASMDRFVLALMKKMTLDEKIGQLNLLTPGGGIATGAVVSSDVEKKIRAGSVGGMFGVIGPDKIRQAQELAVTQSRLRIPLLFGSDVIHGHKTIFPIPLGLSCSWDMPLIEKSAHIAATEATADGLCWVFSPMVDIARDPRWGRIAEGAGEDPYLGAQIAKAMVKGYQGDDFSKENTLMACVKHFALYGAAESGRDYNTTDMSRLRMYQDYLAPYKAAIDAGAGSVMSSFNEIDGIPATANKWLLTDLLRKQWGFKGFVVSDYTAVNEMIAHGMGDLQTCSALALKAGLDMDMVGEGFLTTLKKSLAEGKATLQDIDQACRRILEAKYKLGLFADPYRFVNESRPAKEILTPQNRQEARSIAARSFVLLKNERQTLPLKKSGTIALIGPLADNKRNMLGTWSVAGDWQQSITIAQGIKNVAGAGVNILYAKGANISDDSMLVKRTNVFGAEIEPETRSPQELIKEAVDAAGKSDVIVAVVGEAADMSGEASSRSDIGLPESQENLLKELAKTGKPLVIVLFNGRPMTLGWENRHADALLDAWFGGTEAGNAIADVLFGQYNPSGKLTTSFPRSVGQVPIYYNHKNTGRPYNGEENAKFKSDYLDIANEPLFPFGYGLSYTGFAYSDIVLSKPSLRPGEKLEASVTLSNTGNYDGEETVQLYIRDLAGSVTRPVKELKGFKKVFLKKGESKKLVFSIGTEDLKFYNSSLQYVYEPGDFKIFIGGSSRDTKEAGFTLLK
ncbi:MAG TPA: beta-glucosidase BglX [Chitinophagaceae bacterium]|nr:beta-glucosidase BglX [Chitinophagaceae bacterium]